MFVLNRDMGHFTDHLRQPVQIVLPDPPCGNTRTRVPSTGRRGHPRLRQPRHETDRSPQPLFLLQAPHLHSGIQD